MSTTLQSSMSLPARAGKAEALDALSALLDGVEAEGERTHHAPVWDTLELSTETVTVDDRSISDGGNAQAYRFITAAVTGIHEKDIAA